MKKAVDVIIIGTGTAALSAAAEVIKKTQNFIIVSNGIYGTTCILAGCMPSKVLIQGSTYFQSRHQMAVHGIQNVEQLRMDTTQLFDHVRAMREHFLGFIGKKYDKYRPYIIEGAARFVSPNQIILNDDIYEAKNIIIATGSRPFIPEYLRDYEDYILTSDNLFDLQSLPSSIAVIGLSILGAEMAQCFARLGVEVHAYHDHHSTLIGGLTDQDISDYAVEILRSECVTIALNTVPEVTLHQGKLLVNGIQIEKIFVAESRVPNLEGLGLEAIGVCGKGEAISNYNPETMQVGSYPIFIAGDVKLGRSILNEACDEGRIAGLNACSDEIKPYPRRAALQMCYTNPTLAIAGAAFEELQGKSIKIGVSSYEDQGRAKIMGQSKGLVHIYASADDHKILGAEICAPGGEHLAHMLSWIIAKGITVEEAVFLPFYHPSLEEGLKTAFEDLARQFSL